MNASRTTPQDVATVAARWLLGAIFIYMGLHKAVNPVPFLKLVNEYHIVHVPLLLNLIAAALPWFEVLCGLMLVAGVAVRGTALVLLVMLAFFTTAVLRRALQIAAGPPGLPFTAVKFDCGCGNGVEFAWRKLIENSLQILAAVWLVASRSAKFCARFALLPGMKAQELGAGDENERSLPAPRV
jgi:putative oxidoreductase